MIKKTEQEITVLGDNRFTIRHLQIFLSRLVIQFYNLITSALHDNYYKTDPTFFYISRVDNYSIRLRALTYRLNSDFSSYIRDNR